jgi:hypothetical protein
MKGFYSEACYHNQYPLCKEEGQFSCHFIDRNDCETPEEFKQKVRALAAIEEPSQPSSLAGRQFLIPELNYQLNRGSSRFNYVRNRVSSSA